MARRDDGCASRLASWDNRPSGPVWSAASSCDYVRGRNDWLGIFLHDSRERCSRSRASRGSVSWMRLAEWLELLGVRVRHLALDRRGVAVARAVWWICCFSSLGHSPPNTKFIYVDF